MKTLGLTAAFLSLIISPVVRADRIDDLEKQVALLLVQQKQMQQDIASLKSQLSGAATKPLIAGAPAAVGPKWTVIVISNSPPDIAQTQQQLSDEQKRLSSLQTRADDLQSKADSLAPKGGVNGRGGGGGSSPGSVSIRPAPYVNQEVLGQAQSAAASAEEDVRKSKTKVLQLQKKLEDSQSSRIVVCTTESGQATEVIGRGDVYKPMAESMFAGKKYAVEGQRSMADGKYTIVLRSVLLLPEQSTQPR